ncbi:MAG: helix-turn-helix domain-containing protein [Filifactoraceae bacterium]
MDIKNLRKDKGLKLRDLSDITGISVSWLSRVERGQVEPSKKVRIAIINALKEECCNGFK